MDNHENHKNHKNHTTTSLQGKVNPCTDKLTDLEYLEHMIPHHQVAVDMSNMLIPHTNNPQMLHLCREIIYKQNYEIWEMTLIKRNLMETVFYDKKGDTCYNKTKFETYEPEKSKAKSGDCNPLFFKPNDHEAHMKHMKITDKSYLEHMIPHHQVAIDMSKRLLLYTNNSYLMTFCRNLILDQEREILFMNNILHNRYNTNSELLRDRKIYALYE